MEKRISDRAVSSFCRMAAMMISAGIQPEEAVEFLWEEAEKQGDDRTLKQLYDRMTRGIGLAQAVQETKALPDYAAKLLRVGEVSGRLEETLNILAEEYQRRDRLKSRIKNAVLYPIILLILMCGVLAVLVFAVLPVFEHVYNGLSGGLQASTYWYVVVAGVIGRSSLVVIVGICVLLLGGGIASKWDKGESVLLSVLYHTPAIGAAFSQLEVSRITYVLSSYLASGLDADLALEEAGEVIHHPKVRKQIQLCQEKMAAGESLAKSLCESQMLQPLHGRILLAAAQSGNLDEALAKVAEESGQEAEDCFCDVLEGIEPVLTGFLTLAIGLTLLSAMLPLAGILGSIG